MWEKRSSHRRERIEGERLKDRRRETRRRLSIEVGVLCLVLLASFVWLTWQPYMRITNVASTTGEERVVTIGERTIAGSYYGIIPRDSIFFLPEHAIREAILEELPAVGAVSIARPKLTAVAIESHKRVPAGRWCGSTGSPKVDLAPSGVEGCYFFDANGYIFAPVHASSTVALLHPFVLYAPLEGVTGEPLRASLKDAKVLPPLFDFARQVGTFGSPVLSIAIHDDEVDDLLASGTRITYVLGEEERSFALLTSSKSDINLKDGSLEYVDLRFPAKVYLKKK